MAGKKPNILLIMVDQLAPQFLSAYGHPLVKTHNIDRLCADGVVFDAAYTNAPLCAPARYVMMTGRLPSKIGAWDNAAELSSEVPTFAHYLSSLGYRTCLSGKMHFCGPDQLHGFEERLTTDVYPADFTWTPQWDEPAKALDWFHTMEVVRKAGTCLRSTYLDFDDEVTFTPPTSIRTIPTSTARSTGTSTPTTTSTCRRFPSAMWRTTPIRAACARPWRWTIRRRARPRCAPRGTATTPRSAISTRGSASSWRR
jgi:choline-sulfatase